jgi:hypothetical protein
MEEGAGVDGTDGHSRRRVASAEHGFQDEIPLSPWNPARRRFEEQVTMLTRALRSTDQCVHELAIVQLSLLGPRVVDMLTSELEGALEESDRRQASHQSLSSAERTIAGLCHTLGIIGSSDAIVDLAVALPRKEAVEALAKIGGERALELVMDTIENDSGTGGSLRSYSQSSSWPSVYTDADPAFVRRVFLLFGDIGKKRLQEELLRSTGSKHAAVAEIIRILG